MTAPDTLPGFRVYRWSRRDGGIWVRDRSYLSELSARARVRIIESVWGTAATYEAEQVTKSDYVNGR